MSRIFRDSSVLNQFGSPSINSNTLANRPTFGQPGRLFVSTDTLAIYRDTGTAWDNLTSGGGGSQNLEQVTTIGNTSTKGIFLGASGSLTTGSLLEVKGSSLFTGNSGNLVYIGSPSITPNGASLDVYGYTVLRNTVNSAANLGPILYSQYTINYAGTQLSGFANSLFAQDIYNVSASTSVAFSTQSGTTLSLNTYKFSNVATITFNQPGGTIRAASSLTAYSQFQNTAAGTITHAAGICILGVENLGGSALNITNNYQLLINASDEFANTATFNPLYQWGIYQNGANDKNYFAGKVFLNATTPISDEILRVNGIARINNVVSTDAMYGLNGFNLIGGNAIIGTGTDNGYKLQVNGSGIFKNYNPGGTALTIATTVNQPLMNFVNNGGGSVASIGSTGGGVEQLNIKNEVSGGAINFVIASTTIATMNTSSLLLNTNTNPNNVTFKVNGNVEITTPTATGIHTPTAQHLPIYVNNTLYYLQLLN
jgi:hypothetical protein